MTIGLLESETNPEISKSLLAELEEIVANDSGAVFEPIPRNYEQYLTRCLCGKLLILGNPKNDITPYGENCNPEHTSLYTDS